jgi:hypothetical protein
VAEAEVSARRTFQGAWALSTLHDGYFVERQYMGYTKREDLAMFRSELAGDR